MEMNSTISLIAAIGRNRELGKQGALIWRIPEDLKRFRDLTTGHPVIMGRKTFESIGRPLPGRSNIVVTRASQYQHEGVTIAHSLEEAVQAAVESAGADEIFVIGGGELYTQALPLAERLYLTVIDAEERGADAFFPAYEHIFSRVVDTKEGEHENLHFKWITLEK